MAYERGNPNDPTMGSEDTEQTRIYQSPGEIMPRAEHEGVDVPIPPPPLPVPIQPQSPKPPILVQRRTLSTLLLLIVVLFIVVGALLYKSLSQGNKTVAVSTTSSPSAAASVSPSPTAPTDSAAAQSPSATPAAAGSPSGAGTTTATAAASDAGTSAQTAVPVGSFSPVFGTQFLGEPVDGSVDTQIDVHISNADYPDSVRFYCPTSGMLDWNVAGYSTFMTTFGIPDDARSATGITNTVTFADQNGKVLNVSKTSIGQPAKVQFRLSGVERLVITCDRQGSNDSVNNLIALGNATVSTS